ncbi:MAG: iron uptake porin, partial [Rivularia sp. ALOHA_DT_140]|nr:iron uptake porin [Rivularia sp. ALOHA_DT_140]
MELSVKQFIKTKPEGRRKKEEGWIWIGSLSLLSYGILIQLCLPSKAVSQPILNTPEGQRLEVANSSLSNPSQKIAQQTSVDELSDVKPTDWAYQALKSLIERYGVITGLPDGTFKGNRAVTRYEFAVGLAATLDKLEGLIKNAVGD